MSSNGNKSSEKSKGWLSRLRSAVSNLRKRALLKGIIIACLVVIIGVGVTVIYGWGILGIDSPEEPQVELERLEIEEEPKAEESPLSKGEISEDEMAKTEEDDIKEDADPATGDQLTAEEKPSTGRESGEEEGYLPGKKIALNAPVEGEAEAGFGWRFHPVFKDWRLHEGKTYSVPSGTEIVAAGSGRVIDIRFDRHYGEVVLIEHDERVDSLYAHLNEVLVERGDYVEAGQVIARSGQTGVVDKPQFYFEVRRNGQPVNPGDYLE